MASTPEKASSVSFTSTNLSDSDLPVANFSKTELANFLNGVQGSVTFFFASEGGDSTDIYLVLADTVSGTISSTNQLQSANLPCPRYCK